MTSLRPPKPELDPARHWLVYSQYEETPDGVGRFRPITLDEAASRGKEVLETGSDDTGKPLNRSGIVVLPPGRATIAGCWKNSRCGCGRAFSVEQAWRQRHRPNAPVARYPCRR